MKGLCTVSTGDVVNILVTGDDMPEVGKYYNLEDAIEGTSAQNRTFHALTMEYFYSGQSSYSADNYADFKNQIKRHLGEGFECFVYAELYLKSDDIYSVRMKDAKTKNDIPQDVLTDPDMKDMIRGKLKSWSDYTKKQRKNCIDAVINEMMQCGINTAKFQEILKGMNYDG